ncbi:MAG: GEVED domain-containing protein [Caldilineaceae bacterium]
MASTTWSRPSTAPNLDRRDDGLRLDSVNLRHCEFNTIKVAVSIDSSALSLLAANDGMGYLNVWVDSNRDGDWADSFDCPRADDNKIALEHIVIDLPINAAVLGAGMHELLVDTTVPVAFPTEGVVAGMPAWLRITLSEKPSNKTLTAGTLKYGDGRGYDEPFRLGETEDYLLRAPGQSDAADMTINKRGHLQPEFDTTTRTRFWQVNWVVNYANIGDTAATNVHLVDNLGTGQTLQSVRALPPISPTISGSTVEANLTSVAAGAGGTLILRTVVPYTTAPGTVLRNEAVISAGNDSVTINNTAVATVTVPLLPPLITSPVPGTTCTGALTVTGHAQAGVDIDLYVDGALATTTQSDATGNWSTGITLADGSHDLYAVARQSTLTSEPTPIVMVIVDSSLFWNPMSLRFVDEEGRVIRPSGRLDESGWSVFLRAEHTYTISLQICCEDPNVQVAVELNGDIIPLSDPDDDGTYTASVTSSGRVVGSIRICVICELIKRCSDGELTIDPEGTVFNLLTGQPVSAADVACFQATVSSASTEQSYALWPAEDYQQINPQSVGADGYFSFFTPPGTYQLDVSKTGYQPYRSWDLVVVDAPVHVDVPLTPLISQAANQQVDLTDDGFEPAVVTVEPGAVIEWTNIGDGLHTSTSVTPAVTHDGSQAAGAGDNGAWDSGLLTPGSSYKRQLTQEGTYTYRDSENPAFTATIIVAEADEPPVTKSNTLFIPLVNR